MGRRGTRPKPLAERFWAKVDRSPGLGPAGDCWLWTATSTEHGYGRFNVTARRPEGAHRVAYRLVKGEFESSLAICHRCDNPPCVNPAHLFAATQIENCLDRDTKGRVAQGEHHYASKLTAQQVVALRAEYAEGGISQEKLGQKYGLSRTGVQRIVEGRAWKSV